MKYLNFAIISLAIVNFATASSNGLASWNTNDIKHFLQDRKVEFDKSLSETDLQKLASDEFNKLKRDYGKVSIDVNRQDQQHILQMATDPHSNLNDILPFHNWDFFNTQDEKYSPVSDWIFESWSLDSLKSFLKSNKLKFDKKASRRNLVDLAKEKYADISKTNDVSGNYPGDWLYNSWNIKDVKNWLKEYDVPFEDSQSREELLNKVKQFIYSASLSVNDSKDSLLNSLDLGTKSIFDTAGQIKDDFYDDWSYSQLREWLYYGGFIDTKPGAYSDDLSIEKLKKIAKSNKNYLANDIKSWADENMKTANPILQKGSKDVYDNIINSTFGASIEKWSKERLRDFLSVREIKFSKLMSKAQLIQLVKENINIPIKTKDSESYSDWLLNNLSTEYIREWLVEQGQSVEGTRKELIKRVSNCLYNPIESVKIKSKSLKPSQNDFKNYIISNYKKGSKKLRKKDDELINDASRLGEKYYDFAVNSIMDSVEGGETSAESKVKHIQAAALEYSLDLVSKYQDTKIEFNKQVESAQIAAKNFARTLSTKLEDNQNKLSKIFHGFISSSKSYLSYGIDLITSRFYQHKSHFEKASSDAFVTGKEYMNSAGKTVMDTYEENKPKAEQAYKDASKKANKFYKENKPKAESAYNDAATMADKLYKENKPKAEQAYKDASKKANKFYKENKPKAESAYSDAVTKADKLYKETKPKAEAAYKKATDTAGEVIEDMKPKVESAYNDAADSVESAYVEHKPTVEKAAKDVYDTVIDYSEKTGNRIQKSYHDAEKMAKNSWTRLIESYSNADLKSYLKSFGFEPGLLNSLSRYQLTDLAQEQSELFFGSKSKWDKPITEVLRDTSDSIQVKLGLKKKESFWSKLTGHLWF